MSEPERMYRRKIIIQKIYERQVEYNTLKTYIEYSDRYMTIQYSQINEKIVYD